MGSLQRKKLDSILAQVQCKICQGIVNQNTGLSCSNCNSKLCKTCYQDFQWSDLSKKLKSPCCKDGYISEIFLQQNTLQESLYKILRFKCKIRGCESFLTYEEFIDKEQHNDCRRKKYQCTYCNMIIEGQSKLSHQIKCNKKPIECDYCHKLCASSQMEEHLIFKCEQAQKQRQKCDDNYLQSGFNFQQIPRDENSKNELKSFNTKNEIQKSDQGNYLFERLKQNQKMENLIGNGEKFNGFNQNFEQGNLKNNSLQETILGKRKSGQNLRESQVKNKMCEVCDEFPKYDNKSTCNYCSSLKKQKRSKINKENETISALNIQQNDVIKQMRENSENQELKNKISELEIIIKQKEQIIARNQEISELKLRRDQDKILPQEVMKFTENSKSIEILSNLNCDLCQQKDQLKISPFSKDLIQICSQCIYKMIDDSFNGTPKQPLIQNQAFTNSL